MASEVREDDWQPVGEMSLNGRDYLKRLIFSHRYDRIRVKLKYMRKGPSGTNPQLIFHLEPNEFDEFVRLLFEAKRRTAATSGVGSPYWRPCCDHCNNLAGDPGAHDYGDESAHDGPCGQCADERARAEAIRDAE